MRTTLASILILAAATIGCGGKSKSETADPCKDPCKDMKHGEGEGEGEAMEHEQHVMTPEMTAFHDVLKPLWHAEAGPQRTDAACEASGPMLDLGNDIQTAGAPEGTDAEAWDVALQRLMLAIVGLQDACPMTPDHPFDDAFTHLHETFHGLLEQMPKE